jgi:hypothetical protein
MPRKRSLLQRQLDDSSSDDDDCSILSAAVIVDTFANAKKKNTVALSQVIECFIVTEKAATRGCFKIIWR